MPDDLNDPSPPDTSRINLDQAHEVRYWIKRLGITREELWEAVKDAGTSVDAVIDWLRRKNATKGIAAAMRKQRGK